MPKHYIPIPVEALGIDGAKPGPGDPVGFTVEGRIDRIEGEIAHVLPETANGVPMPETPAQKRPEDEEAELRKQAAEIDDQELYG